MARVVAFLPVWLRSTHPPASSLSLHVHHQPPAPPLACGSQNMNLLRSVIDFCIGPIQCLSVPHSRAVHRFGKRRDQLALTTANSVSLRNNHSSLHFHHSAAGNFTRNAMRLLWWRDFGLLRASSMRRARHLTNNRTGNCSVRRLDTCSRDAIASRRQERTEKISNVKHAKNYAQLVSLTKIAFQRQSIPWFASVVDSRSPRGRKSVTMDARH